MEKYKMFQTTNQQPYGDCSKLMSALSLKNAGFIWYPDINTSNHVVDNPTIMLLTIQQSTV